MKRLKKYVALVLAACMICSNVSPAFAGRRPGRLIAEKVKAENEAPEENEVKDENKVPEENEVEAENEAPEEVKVSEQVDEEGAEKVMTLAGESGGKIDGNDTEVS